MGPRKRAERASRAKRKLHDSAAILKALGFGPKQSNETAAYVLLALLDLLPSRE